MLPALHHLGGEVVEGAAEGVAARCGGVDGPPEVCDLELSRVSYEEVFGLDIAMDDVLSVAVGQGAGELQGATERSENMRDKCYGCDRSFVQSALLSHLEDILRGLALPESPLALQMLVQLPPRAVRAKRDAKEEELWR